MLRRLLRSSKVINHDNQHSIGNSKSTTLIQNRNEKILNRYFQIQSFSTTTTTIIPKSITTKTKYSSFSNRKSNFEKKISATTLFLLKNNEHNNFQFSNFSTTTNNNSSNQQSPQPSQSKHFSKPQNKQLKQQQQTQTSMKNHLQSEMERIVLAENTALSAIELSEKPYLFRGTGKFTLPDSSDFYGQFKFTWEPAQTQTKTTNLNTTKTTTSTTTPNGKGKLTLLDGIKANQSYEGNFETFNGSGSAYIESSRFTNCETQFKDGKVEGRAVIRYPNGYRFEGEWKDLDFVSGKLQMGKLGTYDGSFKEGVFEGSGTFVMMDGSRYEGNFSRGLFEGKGKLTNPDGASFEGSFKQGKRQGLGLLLNPSRSLKYEGNFEDDSYSGEGWLETSSFIYKGQFKFGEFNGQGNLTQKNGIEYEGEWKMGKRSGSGVAKFFDGSSFVGLFENDQPEGQGKLTLPDRKTSLEGVWLSAAGASQQQQQSQQINQNSGAKTLRVIGTVRIQCPEFEYNGDLLEGRISGRGIMKLKNGDVYAGEFLNDQFHGRGQLVNADGTMVTGIFREGKFVEGMGEFGKTPKQAEFGWKHGVLIALGLVSIVGAGLSLQSYYAKETYYSNLKKMKAAGKDTTNLPPPPTFLSTVFDLFRSTTKK